MKNNIIQCPHCGNKTPQSILNQTCINEPLIGLFDNCVGYVDNYYYLTQCQTCKQVSFLYNSPIFWETDFDNLEKSALLFPYEKIIHNAIPKNIQKIYLEAKKIQKTFPKVYVILIRKCLEQICLDKKAKGLNLKQKIDFLAKNNALPSTLKTIADVLRFFGNEGAHNPDLNMYSYMIDILDELFWIFIDYLYIVPIKIDLLRDELKRNKKSR